MMQQFIYERYFQQVTRRDFHQSALLLQYARERQTTPHLLWLRFMHHIQKQQLDNTLANLIEYLSVSAKQSDGKVACYTFVNNCFSSQHGFRTVNDVICGLNTFGSAVVDQYSFDLAYEGASVHGYDINTNCGSIHQFNKLMETSSTYPNYDVPYSSPFGSSIAIAQIVDVMNTTSMTYRNGNFIENGYDEGNEDHQLFVRTPYTYEDFLRVKREAEEVFEKKLAEEQRRMDEEEKRREVVRNIHDMLN